MKVIYKIIISVTIITTLFIINNVSALEYQSSELVFFTLNPTVNITISDNLTIPSLSPGDGKDSNIITVTASSNAMSGYTLSSTVGDSATYPTNELRKDGTNTTYKFTNLTSNIDSLTNFSDNEWGYSYSTDSGTTWQSGDITGTPALGYDGLPLYTTESPITLINSTDASTNSVQFKIGARASTTQVAGEYTNIINFIGVANPDPAPKTLDQVSNMQDSFSCVLTPEGTTNTLTDTRDGKSYPVVKFKDGKCWMTKNLDLDGGTTLTANDTNMPADYTLPVANGFQEGNKLPESSTEGFSDDAIAYVFNSNNPTNNCASPGCYSYYSWTAATLGSLITGNADAPYSICPKGWRLPTIKPGTDFASDFRNLVIVLGGLSTIDFYNENTNPTGNEIYNKLSSTSLKFINTNYYRNNSFRGGGYGFYWSATGTSIYARSLAFNSIYVYSAYNDFRGHGFAVRCLHD